MIDISKINPIKQQQVMKAITIAQKNEIIKRLIVFGSSVTSECSEDSDIDICLDIQGDTKDIRLHKPVFELNEACDYNCDILFYSKVGPRLKNEIDNKGVTVYAS